MPGLIRMRLAGFVRAGRVVPPLITALVVLGILYGGGAGQAGESYGVSAVLLFPVLAWQAKLLLDADPDVQRRLALVAVGGGRREAATGVVAAGAAGLGTILVGLVVPWLVGGITGPVHPDDLPLAEGIALGVWAHLLALPPAIALGALASRAASGRPLSGIVILIGGVVGSLVLGLKSSVAPWLAPPLMAAARAVVQPDAVTLTRISLHALVWTVVALAGYAWLRRRGA